MSGRRPALTKSMKAGMTGVFRDKLRWLQITGSGRFASLSPGAKKKKHVENALFGPRRVRSASSRSRRHDGVASASLLARTAYHPTTPILSYDFACIFSHEQTERERLPCKIIEKEAPKRTIWLNYLPSPLFSPPFPFPQCHEPTILRWDGWAGLAVFCRLGDLA